MILTELRLTNFGTLKGVQSLSLRPKPGKPIVLVGGKNGSGKSTILDAIRLCFYGQQALGARTFRDQYLSHLRSRIHRNPNLIIQPDYASISLEFEFADIEGLHTYKVTRSWEERGVKIVENLEVERDHHPLNELSAEHWQDFIRDLIPMGVSQLFFFDGEKIQQLAEDSSDQRTLADAVKLLLGIDTVERLDTDLGIYLSRSMAQQRSSETNQLGVLETQLEQLRSRLEALTRAKQQQEMHVLEIKKAADRAEQQLASAGGSFARNRESHLKEAQRVKSEIGEIRATLRELCSGLLPFSLAPDLCLALKQSLILEEQIDEKRAAATLTAKAAAAVRADLTKKSTSFSEPVTLRLRKEFADRVEHTLKELVPDTQMEVRHGYSAKDRRNLYKWIDLATEDVAPKAIALSKRLDDLTRAEYKVATELKRIPPDEVLSPLLAALQQHYKQLAEADQKLSGISEQIQSCQNEIADLSRKCQQEAQNLASRAAEEKRLSLVPKVRRALEEFKATLTLRKIRALEEAVTDCFNILCRKKDSVRRLSIDPNSFTVTIRDKDGQPIPKGQLSAGEKQVYAISMLWALARTSGRPLPIIVDTPLARLDRDHRSLLAQHYFPNASHQVLLLSTDTEVDEQYFEQLSSGIARAYLLDFDPVERFTTAAPGYFWRHHESLKVTAN